MKSKRLKGLIISVVLALVVSISLVACLFLFLPKQDTPPTLPPDIEHDNNDNENNENNNQNSNDNNDDTTNDNQTSTPTLTVPANISLDLLQTGFVFEYNTTNLANYVVTISIEDISIASINSSNVIIPNKVGQTKIITSINTNPTITKETILKINGCIKSVNMIITNHDGSTPTTYFTNTDYILQLNQNMLENTPPKITNNNYEENIAKIIVNNIKNIELINTENNTYFYKFNIETYGDFSFEYKGKYVSSSLEKYAYLLPNNFEINFNNINVINNTINLYLFNNNFTKEASADGYYNDTTFEIIQQTNCYDDVIINSTNFNNIVSLANNKITALIEGSTTITFYSNISKISKTYTIVVSKINLDSIIINNTSTPLNTSCSIELKSNETYLLNFTPNPIYACCNINVEYNNSELSFKDNKISLINNCTNSTFKIKNNSDVVYTLNITIKPAYNYTLEVINSTCDYTFDKDAKELEITLAAYNYVVLKCTVINQATGNALPTQNFGVEIEDINICDLAQEVSSGNIALKFKNKGTTTITITNNINQDKFILTVVVN